MTINLQNEVKVLGLAYSQVQLPMEMAFSHAAGRYAEPGQLAALLRQIATPVAGIRLFSAPTRRTEHPSEPVDSAEVNPSIL